MCQQQTDGTGWRLHETLLIIMPRIMSFTFTLQSYHDYDHSRYSS